MLFESDKVMFEIYRETEYTGRYRVVYFTELQDHNKETEINHNGERVDPQEVERALGDHIA
jgi:hypothetical protein